MTRDKSEHQVMDFRMWTVGWWSKNSLRLPARADRYPILFPLRPSPAAARPSPRPPSFDFQPSRCPWLSSHEMEQSMGANAGRRHP